MKNFVFILLILICFTSLKAQLSEPKKMQKKGVSVGLSLGLGQLKLSENDTTRKMMAATLPNIRIGYMLSERFALQLLLPGTPYQKNGKTRGFEAIVISGQYWIKNRWWILGGAGVSIDAPAFWTIDDPKDIQFHWGVPAVTFATGFEILQRKSFTIDLQYRVYSGKVNLDQDKKLTGISNMFSVGFNWY